jgi:serine/threonine-protein kinase HipA
MNQVLAIWSEGKRVGEVAVEQGRWRFTYNDDWLKDKQAFQLSPHFPFQAETFIDSSDDKRVEWFFENLLPEGGMREALARQAHLSSEDSFGLLSRYGEESAGALILLAAGASYPEKSRYIELTHDDLRSRIARATNTPLLASSENLHMSLAGVQNKLGVLFNADKMSLPEGAAASSHILKPDNDNTAFKCCPANEFFCMRLARELGLAVPDVTLLHIPETIYLTTRFDREITPEGITRKHQIDLCQLLNKWVGYKYESHGGITAHDLFSALELVIQPAVARGHVIRWIIFNYLIGNNDAHAKNLSFLVTHKGIRIAPFYDLLCVQAYLPESVLAMSIDGENKPGWIEAKHWNNLAVDAGISKRLLKEYLEHQSENIETAAKKIVSLPDFTVDEVNFLKDSVLDVIRQRVGFIRSVLNQ